MCHSKFRLRLRDAKERQKRINRKRELEPANLSIWISQQDTWKKRPLKEYILDWLPFGVLPRTVDCLIGNVGNATPLRLSRKGAISLPEES